MIRIQAINGDQVALSDDGSRGTRNGVPLSPVEAKVAYDAHVTAMAGGTGGSLALMAVSVLASLWLGKVVAKKTKSKALGLVSTLGAYYWIGPEVQFGDVTFPPYKDEVKQALGFKKKLPAVWNSAYWSKA